MITTKDYAEYRDRLGTTIYKWTLWFYDEDKEDNVFVASGESPDLKGAQDAAQAALKEHPQGKDVMVNRGAYERDEINDHEFGTVLDVIWIEDDRWVCYGWRRAEAGVEWEEESW